MPIILLPRCSRCLCPLAAELAGYEQHIPLHATLCYGPRDEQCWLVPYDGKPLRAIERNPSLVLLADIIRVCLDELGERGLIDWFPGDNEPESFVTECEIDTTKTRHGFPLEVRMCDRMFFLWEREGKLEVYYSMPLDKAYG